MKNSKRARLVTEPVGKTLISLTIPMVVGIVGIMAFNLADTFFVGRFGTDELSALSFTFPVIFIINSLAHGLGIGVSAVISRAIGEGDHYRIQRLTTDSLILSVLLVALCAGVGQLTIEPVFRLLGATPDILSLIKQYMRIWYFGVLFVVVPMVGNSAIRATGDTKTPAAVMMVAAACNFLLDPMLIFGFGPFPRLGIQGAAIATVISRAITFFVALFVLHYRDRMLTFTVPRMKMIMESWKRVLYIGLPNAGTRIIMPLTMGIITRMVSSYGKEVVAGYGVSSRIEIFSLTVVMALRSVIAPFVGQNWGAGRYDRMKRGIKVSEKFSLMWGVGVFAVLALAAEPIVSLFNDSPVVISTAVMYLRIVSIGYGLQGIFLISTAAMNVLNKPLHAAGFALFQMFALYIPLAFLGSFFFGLPGIFSALAFVYCIAGIGSHFLLLKIV
ncbi:MAG: MATE family efflux transporter, partial [Candidatus Cloacimonadota bacterium]